jgi:hypothetical protein
MTTTNRHSRQFAICIRNDDYPASLEVRKIYELISDTAVAEQRYLRVIDESREDYLYPEEYFVPIELPQPVEEALMSTAGPG